MRVTGIWPIASGDQCDCGVISYPDPVIGVALGYVHVYEINLETGGTSLPVTISYSITQFTGSLVAGDCDTNVTPQDLKIRVEDGAGNYAEAAMAEGWSGSVVWDGQWAGGGAWDGCSQVTISLKDHPNLATPRQGLTDPRAIDSTCGTCETLAVGVDKSIDWPMENYARVMLSPGSLFIAQIDEEVTFTANGGGSRKRLVRF